MTKYISGLLCIIIAIGFFSCASSGIQGRVDRFNDMGITCLRNHLYQDAIFWFSKSLELAPDNFQALNNIAISYEALGYFDKALDYYEKAYEVSSNTRIKSNLESLKKAMDL